MPPAQKPRTIIVSDDADISAILSVSFKLKNYEVFKASSSQECLDILDKDQNIVVIIVSRIAADRDAMLIVKIRKINPEIPVLVIADEDTAKTRVLDYGADEFALKPMSVENVADKAFNLLSRGRRIVKD